MPMQPSGPSNHPSKLGAQFGSVHSVVVDVLVVVPVTVTWPTETIRIRRRKRRRRRRRRRSVLVAGIIVDRRSVHIYGNIFRIIGKKIIAVPFASHPLFPFLRRAHEQSSGRTRARPTLTFFVSYYSTGAPHPRTAYAKCIKIPRSISQCNASQRQRRRRRLRKKRWRQCAVRSRQSAVERRPSTVSSNICRSVSQVVWAQENQKSSNTTIRRSGDRVNVLKSKLARAKLEGQKRHEKRLQLQTQRKLRLHMESDWDCARVAINI